MTSQHLSDEAVAAFADGVLTGHARERAARHSAHCPECAHAVAVQREAVWALRAAPAPTLPLGLVDRLRSVPSTTPVTSVPSAISADGSALFSAFGTMTAAALVGPGPRTDHSTGHSTRHATAHRIRPIAITAAAVAAAGLLAVGSDVQSSAGVAPQPGVGHSAGFVQVAPSAGGPVQAPVLVPVNARVRIGP